MKRLVCLLLALLLALSAAGCTSRAEKEAAELAAAQETARLEAVEAAKAAVGDYNAAAEAYNAAVGAFNENAAAVAAVNAAYDEALDAVRERIDSEPIPYDPETLSAVEAALASAREARTEDPEPIGETAEMLSAADSLSEQDARSLAEKAAADARALRERALPETAEAPDYSAQLAAVDAALEPYEASLEIIRPVIAPTDEYVMERLMQVSTIAAVNAVTEGHDPNGNLDADGGYIGCVFFRDSRISVWSFRLNPGADRNDPVDVGTQGGGSVEIYRTQQEAENRAAFFKFNARSIGAYGVVGSVVVRVSDELSRSKQQELLEAILEVLLVPDAGE